MENGLAARNGGRVGLAALVAILLLGLGLRLGEAWDGRTPVYDATAYAAIAANLDAGHGFTVGPRATQPSSNYSPGLPLFVAGLYKLSGGVHERLARIVLALVGALSVLFAYLIGGRLSRALHRPRSSEVGAAPGARARLVSLPAYREDNSPIVWPALVGALVVAIYPALLEYQGMLMSEPLAATLLSGGVLALLWAWEGGWVRWVLPGALFGALALVRPEYLAVAALVALAVLAREVRLDWRGSLLRAAIFLGAGLVVIVPWTIRNAVALDRFVPISTGGGQVLFAGTYLPSDGDPEKVGEEVVARHPELFSPRDAQRLRLEQILAHLAHSRYPDLETDQALSKMGKEQLWADVSEEPLEYAGFVATKIWRIWSHGPRDVMREPVWEMLHWALVAFGLFGLALLAWRRRWEALLIGTIFLTITAVSALLVASPRRVLVLVPLLAALAAVALSWLAAALRSPSDFRPTPLWRKSDGLRDERPDSLSRP
jgi:4-amino-4-deoxy-L-arabinose transferase-like glycosyltransferase